MKWLSVILLSAGLTRLAVAQDTTATAPTAPFWLTAGIGPATLSSMGGGIGFSWNVGHQPAFQIGFSANQRLKIFGDPPLTAEIHGAVGTRVYSSSSALAAMFVGPALVLQSYGSTSRDDVFTAGIMTSFQAFIMPSRGFGIGLEAFGNLNRVQNYAGLRIGILVGNKR